MALEEKYGLNKEKRLRRKRQMQALEDEPAPLEPDFPYQIQPFDPFFFGAREEWPVDSST